MLKCPDFQNWNLFTSPRIIIKRQFSTERVKHNCWFREIQISADFIVKKYLAIEDLMGTGICLIEGFNMQFRA